VLHLRRSGDGVELATVRKHFNPVVHRASVTLGEADERVDELLILAAACLHMAIDARQGDD